MEIAAQEASALQSEFVGTEHLLLALIKDKEGIAAQILTNFQVSYEKVKEELSNTPVDRSAEDQKPQSLNEQTTLNNWINEGASIEIKLITGDTITGKLFWFDRDNLAINENDQFLIVPKHSVLYYCKGK